MTPIDQCFRLSGSTIEEHRRCKYDQVSFPQQGVYILDIVIDPTNPEIVYAGTNDSGVYFSENGGGTWNALNDGLLTRAVRSLALTEDGSVLYMASEGGCVWRVGAPEVRYRIFQPTLITP